jgi:hypothetical protein
MTDVFSGLGKSPETTGNEMRHPGFFDESGEIFDETVDTISPTRKQSMPVDVFEMSFECY